MHSYHLLQDQDDYGIDWGGPVPLDLDSEDSTVILDDGSEILSVEQRNALNMEMNATNSSLSISEDILVHQYSAAKLFVQSLIIE